MTRFRSMTAAVLFVACSTGACTALRLGAVLIATQLMATESLAQYATVARRGGDPAPGTGGKFYDTLGAPALNRVCDAGFEATLNTAPPGDQGAWVGGGSSLQLIALNNEVAPGTGGGIFRHVGVPDLTPGGEFLFSGLLTTSAATGIDASNNAGLWAGSVGALQLLVQKGDQAPDLAPGVVFGPWPPDFVANSPVSGGLIAAIHLDLAGPGVDATNDNGIWAGTPGDLRLVVRKGDPAPGFPAGHVYSQASAAAGGAGPVVNQTGILGFWGRADNFPEIVWAAWTGPRNDPQPILKTGDTAINMPAGLAFEDLILSSINADGDTSGQGTVSPDIGLGRSVVWRRTGGTVELVRIEDDAVPGLPAGVVWGDVVLDPVINANDVVAFESALAGTAVTTTNDRAIVLGTGPGSLSIAAREGDQAPGLPAGVVFASFQLFTLVLNARDEVAISARLTGVGVTAANDRALFAGPAGALVPVVREGDMIEVAPGVVETVAAFVVLNLGNTGNGDGRFSYFNDRGQVAFLAFFASGRNAVLTWPGDPCDTENLPPVITSAPILTGELGVPYLYDVDATDPNGDDLTYSLDAGPVGMFIDAVSGLVQWTPLEGQQGLAHPVSVRVRDPDGLFATQSFEVQVGSPNEAPTITSVPPTTASVGVEYLYDVDATDPDGDVLTYGFGLSPPSGMTIDPDTGLIRWTPEATHVGAFNFVFVTVGDGNGGSADQPIVIDVSVSNQPPTIISFPPTTATEGSLYSYDVDASDPDGDTLAYSLEAAPEGMTVNAVSGLIEWTPLAAQTGDNGVTVRATDPGGLSAAQSYSIAVAPANRPPEIAAVPPAVIDEGDTLEVAVPFTDPDSTAWTASVDFGDGTGPRPWPVDPVAMDLSLAHIYPDDGTFTVTITVTDEQGASDSRSFEVTVTNLPPILADLLLDPSLVDIGTQPAYASVDFEDPGTEDTHTATIDWGDGTISPANVSETGGAGTATGDHVYALPGVYTVTATVTDDDGGTASKFFQFAVAYDSSDGFVTGGGWFESPEGSCRLTAECAMATGKAHFGFVAKYKKGASTPSGNTDFLFHAGQLSFRSTEYEWLVVARSTARYKGSGTINGDGNYGFLVFATDEKLTASTDTDLLRIQIWDKNDGDHIVYDNEMGMPGDGEASTPIAQGSIVIHTGKN